VGSFQNDYLNRRHVLLRRTPARGVPRVLCGSPHHNAIIRQGDNADIQAIMDKHEKQQDAEMKAMFQK
jgi:hypothetical protein